MSTTTALYDVAKKLRLEYAEVDSPTPEIFDLVHAIAYVFEEVASEQEYEGL